MSKQKGVLRLAQIKPAIAHLNTLILCVSVFLVSCASSLPNGQVNSHNASTALPQTITETITIWALDEEKAFPFNDFARHKYQYPIMVEGASSRTQFDPNRTEDIYEQLRVLLTELLGGEGPDIIILDGCNVLDLIASGALMDLTDIAREAGVYENLIEELQADDGALYYVPFRISAPLLWGNPDIIDEVQSFMGLAQSLTEGPVPQMAIAPEQANPSFGSADPLLLSVPPLPREERSLVSFGSRYEIITLAEALYGPYLVKNNALDTEVLRECYQAMGQMVHINNLLLTGVRLSLSSQAALSFRLTYAGTNQYLGYAELAANSSADLHFAGPAFTALAKGMPLDIRPFPAKGSIYQARGLMAVNKYSKNPQQAMRLVQLLLSDEGQALLMSENNIPITKSGVQLFTEQVFTETLQQDYEGMQQVYGEDFEKIQWLKNAEGFPYDLDALIRGFDTVYLQDAIVYDAWYSNAIRYLDGRCTLDEAVARCEDDLSLYFAERAR